MVVHYFKSMTVNTELETVYNHKGPVNRAIRAIFYGAVFWSFPWNTALQNIAEHVLVNRTCSGHFPGTFPCNGVSDAERFYGLKRSLSVFVCGGAISWFSTRFPATAYRMRNAEHVLVISLEHFPATAYRMRNPTAIPHPGSIC